jgi:hypothetical protein
MKVSIDLGSTAAGAPALLDLEELLATRLLVQGNSGSGKSHLLRRLLEQSAGSVQQAVIDPEGDFVSLAESFGHVVIEGAAHGEAELQRIAARVREHRVSVVFNAEGLDADLQMKRAAAFLGGLFDTERTFWFPMLVIVDEAQLFAPTVAGEVSDEARKASLGAMTNLMCRGRKRGLAGVIATQRLAKLAKNVAAEASNFLMGRTFLDIDMARAADLLGMERRQAEAFRDLERGHFIALGPALARRSVAIRIGDVETEARSASPKLMPLPPTLAEDARELILKPLEAAPARVPPPRRPPPPPDPIAEIARAPSPPLIAFGPSADEVLAQLLAEPEASTRSVAVLYQDFLVRCRRQRAAGDTLDLAAFRRRLAMARAGIDQAGAANPAWDTALAQAGEVPEEMQGVFLLLARAAIERAPCPSDGAVGRACNTHSPKRARRMLDYMEARGFIVARADGQGRRIVALPALGCETAPGNAGAAEGPDLLDAAE